jgi:IS5 family transposase
LPESEAVMAKADEMSRGFGRKSKSPPARKQALLQEQLNREHPLGKLSQAIAWSEIEAEFGSQVSNEGGRPALLRGLMEGLHYLKALYDESDESVVAKWVENPYWQCMAIPTMAQPSSTHWPN